MPVRSFLICSVTARRMSSILPSMLPRFSLDQFQAVIGLFLYRAEVKKFLEQEVLVYFLRFIQYILVGMIFFNFADKP